MNFFQRQDQARRKTRFLLVYYLLSVVMTILAIHSIIVFVVAASREGFYGEVWCDPNLLLLDTVILLAVIGLATLYKVAQLKNEGGDGVAAALGGTLVSPQTTDFQERRLLGVVEEMALASGIHVPNTYILKDEPGNNAFVAGFTPATSVVAVTQGALDYLTRDELQGVIGHEFSHILNQDTNLNLRLIGVLFGLELLAIIGILILRISSETMFWSSAGRRDSDKGNAGLAIVLAAFIIGMGVYLTGLIGRLFSNIIRLAISCQREFLADASSVQFTRNPSGLAGALKKIGSPKIGSKVQNSHSVEASHLFFSNIFSGNFLGHLFDTHPPLTERIRRIEPNFNGEYPKEVKKGAFVQEPSARGDSGRFPRPFGKNGAAAAAGIVPVSAVSPFPDQTLNPAQNPDSARNTVPAQASVPSADRMLDEAGETDQRRLQYAAGLLESIPEAVTESVRTLLGAKGAVCAMLLGAGSDSLERKLFEKGAGPELRQAADTLMPLLAEVSPSVKIPIAERAYAVLKQMTPEEYAEFRPLVTRLIEADGKIDLFEFALYAVLVRDLDLVFGLRKPAPLRWSRIDEVIEPFRAVLGYIAYAGSGDPMECQAAFDAGMAVFSRKEAIPSQAVCTVQNFRLALERLTEAVFPLRQSILSAIFQCIAADGVITETEGELFRAVCAYFEAPMPMWNLPPVEKFGTI